MLARGIGRLGGSPIRADTRATGAITDFLVYISVQRLFIYTDTLAGGFRYGDLLCLGF